MQYTTRLIDNKLMANLLEQFVIGGYTVVRDEDTIVVKLQGEELLWAMTHSSRKHWLARYESKLLTPSKGKA